MYHDVLHILRNDVLIPTKDFGACGCAVVIDRSAHVKAKVLACQFASECVDNAGLAAIGKKGLLGAAKFLSDEPSLHRNAALELLVRIASKMNNDVFKLSKLCGNSLSDKGRKLLEDRAKISKNPARSEAAEAAATLNIASELPRLSLRQTSPASKYALPNPGTTEEGAIDNLFVFSSKLSFESGDSYSNARSDDRPSAVVQGSSSAAASLRARLMKIREKGVTGPVATSQMPEPTSKTVDSVGDFESSQASTTTRKIEPIQVHISCFRALLQRESPVKEDDAAVEKAIDSLRIFHNVLAGKDGALLNISKQESARFRDEIIEHANTSIDLVRR
jgi:hypothetical protein